MKEPCGNASDMVCAPCKMSCPALQGYFMESPCRHSADAVCKKCPEGSYPDPETNAFCVKCPRGTTVSVEKSLCEPCKGLVSANKTRCMEAGDRCPENEYPFDESSCASCPASTFGRDGLRCEACLMSEDVCKKRSDAEFFDSFDVEAPAECFSSL